MNIIFYQTKTKFTNTGDALINKALIDVLRNFGKLYANCSEDIPKEFLDELGILPEEKIVAGGEMAFAMAVIKYRIKNINTGRKVYVFSGLGDVHGGGAKRVMRNLLSSCLIVVYNMLGIKSVRIGRSIGKITKGMEISEKIRSYIVPYNFVRDTQSLNRCKRLGIKNVRICPDMSWIYLKDTNRNRNSQNVVTVNMRGSTLGKYEDDYVAMIKPLCKQILKEIQETIGSEIKVNFVYQVKEDQRVTIELYNELKDEFKCELLDYQLKLTDMEEVYGKSSYHLSNRMHSLLLGYKYGSLPIALIDKEKHLKIASTFEDSKLDKLVIDIKKREIKEAVMNIVNDSEKLYMDIVQCEKNKSDEILKTISEIM